MLALGLQGSPREKGNTNFLLTTFLNALAKKGAATRLIHVPEKNIKPCQGCTFCEKKGYCTQRDDDMSREIYPLLRRADIILAASPMYFYNVSSQLKALIDRSQALWSRRYKLGLIDPHSTSRTGVMLAVGATKGKNLFNGTHLTARYFFDAVSARFTEEMGYRRVEKPGDLSELPQVTSEVQTTADRLDRFFKREKILFLSGPNACRSKMAVAFSRYLAGDRVEALSAGVQPATAADPIMVKVMAEKGLDLFLRFPRSLEETLTEMKPDKIVTIGRDKDWPDLPGATVIDWDIKDPAGKDISVTRQVRDEIEQKVRDLTDSRGVSHER
ncbi:MAG: NAD(P)H-dependent oxidoreductase [Desulfosudaceae bacterium]